MKKLLFAMLIGLCAVQAAPDESVWLTNFSQAIAKAQAEKKTVLMDFTGSDWCGYCIKLHKEVFDTPKFKQYAATNLVLLEVDFPKRKELSPAQKNANESLRKKFATPFSGYPTVVLVNVMGKKLGEEVGYGGDGVDAYIAKLEKMRAPKK